MNCAPGASNIACDECPFRLGSGLAYDADAMEALMDGCWPSCHKLVGLDHIFGNPFPTATRCRGHDSWLRGADGFVTPGSVK